MNNDINSSRFLLTFSDTDCDKLIKNSIQVMNAPNRRLRVSAEECNKKYDFTYWSTRVEWSKGVLKRMPLILQFSELGRTTIIIYVLMKSLSYMEANALKNKNQGDLSFKSEIERIRPGYWLMYEGKELYSRLNEEDRILVRKQICNHFIMLSLKAKVDFRSESKGIQYLYCAFKLERTRDIEGSLSFFYKEVSDVYSDMESKIDSNRDEGVNNLSKFIQLSQLMVSVILSDCSYENKYKAQSTLLILWTLFPEKILGNEVIVELIKSSGELLTGGKLSLEKFKEQQDVLVLFTEILFERNVILGLDVLKELGKSFKRCEEFYESFYYLIKFVRKIKLDAKCNYLFNEDEWNILLGEYTEMGKELMVNLRFLGFNYNESVWSLVEKIFKKVEKHELIYQRKFGK